MPAWVFQLPTGKAPFNEVGGGVSPLKPATPDRFFHGIDSSRAPVHLRFTEAKRLVVER